MTESDKIYINGLTYEEMLRLWRFSPSGTKIFIGESGDYFTKMMNIKKLLLTDGEQVATSKRIGWEA